MCPVVWTRVQDTVGINRAQVFIHAESAEYQEPSISASRKLVLIQTLHPHTHTHSHKHILPKAIEANLVLNLEEQKQLSAIHILHQFLYNATHKRCRFSVMK